MRLGNLLIAKNHTPPGRVALQLAEIGWSICQESSCIEGFPSSSGLLVVGVFSAGWTLLCGNCQLGWRVKSEEENCCHDDARIGGCSALETQLFQELIDTPCMSMSCLYAYAYYVDSFIYYRLFICFGTI